jgi:putative transcriptional regulator
MRYKYDPANPPPADWSRADAMTEEEIVAAALSDPDCPPSTEADLARFVRGPHPRIVRARLGLSVEDFARRYGLPLETVRAWEAGSLKPDAAAKALLRVIDREPEAAARALAEPEPIAR